MKKSLRIAYRGSSGEKDERRSRSLWSGRVRAEVDLEGGSDVYAMKARMEMRKKFRF